MSLGPEDITAILLSLRVAATATVIGLPVALLTALALARGRFWGRSLLDAAAHLPLVLPPVATGYALLLLFGHNGPLGRALAQIGVVLAFHWTGAALAAAVMAFPLMVRPMRLSIEAIEREVHEAGRTLGAGAVIRFFRLTVPLAAPGIAAGAVMGFAKALGEFGATITFVAAIPGETLTVPAAIYQATQSPGEEGHAIALCAVSAALAVAAVLGSELISRQIARRRERG
ncbi:MAG TPA: molybdate ABC transporter permease subunit [Caulobacteraceae bacterium]